MKSFAFAAVIGAASAIDTETLSYLNHLALFNRQVDSEAEFSQRAKRFQAVDAFITEHNASGANYTVAHNKFSDWFAAEYKQLLGYKKDELRPKKQPTLFDESRNAMTVDWVSAGAVTAVKDQGQCGSCWAFSTTGSLEGAHFVATGKLESFSEQQLVDCAYLKYGNFACNGGLQESAYNYYEDAHNAELESVYPYFSGTTMSKGDCAYQASSTTSVTVSDYLAVTPDNATQMKAAMNSQPLAVSIEADRLCFQFYSSGVLDNTNCGTSLDHAVLAVGYGVDSASGLEYWLVKNSWGTSWGDQGYIKLAITDGAGICGVQMEPLAPTTN